MTNKIDIRQVFGGKRINPKIPQMPKGGMPMNMPNGQRINIDPNTLEDMCCIKCGCDYFIQIVKFKNVPRTLSPNGQDAHINMIMSVCGNADCGWVFNAGEWMKHKAKMEEETGVSVDPDGTININEKATLKDSVEAEVVTKEKDNREMCRKCGEFYDKGTEHTCKI